MRLSVISVLILALSSCGGSSQVMSAEFSSMQNCLSSIRNKSNGDLKIVIDKPGDVTGFLADGRNFACQAKTSGTKGSYVEGWFDSKE